MKRKKTGRYRRKRYPVKSLTVQLLCCIFILFLIIAIKKMDSALINKGVSYIEGQLYKDYSIAQLIDGAKQVAASLYTNKEGSYFIMPVDGNGVKETISGESLGESIVFVAHEELQVYASAGGTVSIVETEGNNKIRIEIAHGNDMFTEYRGCTDVYIKPLSKVKQGQIIASVRKGQSNELTFSLRLGGTKVDPTLYIRD